MLVKRRFGRLKKSRVAQNFSGFRAGTFGIITPEIAFDLCCLAVRRSVRLRRKVL